MYTSSPSHLSIGGIENLDSSSNPNSSPRRSARLNPPPTPEQENLATPKIGSAAFASQQHALSLLGGSPLQRKRSPTRATASPRSKNPAAGRATGISPRRMCRGHGREKNGLGAAGSGKKRKRAEDDDDERELDHGPRIKRIKREDIAYKGDSSIEDYAHVPALQLEPIDSRASSYDVYPDPAVGRDRIQEIFNASDAFDTLPFTWEADFEETLQTIYEDFYWSQEVHEMHRTRAEDVEAVKKAHIRLQTAQQKWDKKVSELVLEGQCFLLNEVLSNHEPISFGLD
ncbi:hypothetical protein FRC15_009707 [Serendipita sp. 397]|nr:hypothetical protein FRC15_009707 [Serendipita sp. 397]